MTREEIMRNAKEAGGMFVVIPSVVKLDTELPLSAQMLYGVITWRCNNYAYTWATNRELGEDLGVSPKRVSALLSLLEERGHIETEIEYKEGTHEVLRRYIYPIMKSAKTMRREGPPPKNKDTPPSERAYPSPGTGIPLPENEEVICNINKQKRNKKDSPYSPPEGDGAVSDPAPGDKPGRKTGRGRFVPPDVEQVRAYCRERGNNIDPETFVDYYASKGWVVGRSPMKDWKAAVRTWEQRRNSQPQRSSGRVKDLEVL
ncbi:MAG: helix-turn-helix domain-containing protein [Oscillospiraceae bacterium]|nr:helix-turn-helix domain-containing protein [Oscillospiraceae bacterium]